MRCAECREEMTVYERRREGVWVFEWLRCISCGGQYLHSALVDAEQPMLPRRTSASGLLPCVIAGVAASTVSERARQAQRLM